MGAILAGGLALSWLRDILAPSGSEPADYGTLAAEAADVEVGADGVIFAPYLLGERTPHMDPAARAAFLGLGLNHSRKHLVRAVMEGVAFALLDGLNVMKEMGIAPAEVRFAGGGGAMALWQQIQRDVFALPAYIGDTGGADHGAAYGAAILAAISTGALADPQEVLQRRAKSPLSQPDEGNAARYKQAYARYRAVYPALRAVT
jgi:xylulokinase